jgi:hexokinase
METAALLNIKENFYHELQKASSGAASSLPFIKHQLPDHPLVQVGETFQVLVIGGSVYRKSVMKKESTRLIDLFYEEHDQPIFHDKDHFLSYIVSHLEPHISTVAINFAYPLSPIFSEGKLDGTLLYGTKENEFDGLVGEQVGKSIEEYCKQQTGTDIHVSVANDVICLLLSGLQDHTKETLVGGIMGTGTNITFFHEDYAINLESANFNNFTPSEPCVHIDKASTAPGKALFEKETSGA